MSREVWIARGAIRAHLSSAALVVPPTPAAPTDSDRAHRRTRRRCTGRKSPYSNPRGWGAQVARAADRCLVVTWLESRSVLSTSNVRARRRARLSRLRRIVAAARARPDAGDHGGRRLARWRHVRININGCYRAPLGRLWRKWTCGAPNHERIDAARPRADAVLNPAHGPESTEY